MNKIGMIRTWRSKEMKETWQVVESWTSRGQVVDETRMGLGRVLDLGTRTWRSSNQPGQTAEQLPFSPDLELLLSPVCTETFLKESHQKAAEQSLRCFSTVQMIANEMGLLCINSKHWSFCAS